MPMQCGDMTYTQQGNGPIPSRYCCGHPCQGQRMNGQDVVSPNCRREAGSTADGGGPAIGILNTRAYGNHP
jgi:hypothetical protein